MMAAEYSNEEKRGNVLEHDSAGEFADEKPTEYTDAEETAAIAAENGHVATDKSVLNQSHSVSIAHYRCRFGRPLVRFDPVAERKLRLKIDLMIIPTVSLLYLFCFIDRANIGKIVVACAPCTTHLTLFESRQCKTCGF